MAVFLSCLAAIFHISQNSLECVLPPHSRHKYLRQNIRVLALINSLRNLTRLPQSSSFPFKVPHVELQQLVLHRRGTSCIIYREEQESKEQENRGKRKIKASNWKRAAASNLRWKLVETGGKGAPSVSV